MKSEAAWEQQDWRMRRRRRLEVQRASIIESRERGSRVLDWLEERRRRKGFDDARQLRRPPVEIVRSKGHGDDRDRVPVVAGELLVREDERSEELRAFLRGVGYAPTRRTNRGRVVFTRTTERAVAQRNGGRMVPASARADTPVIDVVDAARAEGFDVEPNHVVALNWVMKSMIGPEYAEPEERPVAPEPMPAEGDAAPLVVVIDTGLDANTVTRNDRWLDGVRVSLATDYDPLDQLNKDGSPAPDGNGHLDLSAGHGTYVAGIVRQVEPAAEVVVLRALDADGLGTDDALADAIERAGTIIGTRPAVINLSLGMHTYDDAPPSEIQAALQALPDNVLVVAAAGNDGDTRKFWPAAFEEPHVIGVAALTEELTRAEWSSHGEWVTCSAVGEGIVSTFVNGHEQPADSMDDPPWDPDPEHFIEPDPYAVWLGTSFAAPQVAARLARLAVDHGVGDALSHLEGEQVANLSAEGHGFAVRPITPV